MNDEIANKHKSELMKILGQYVPEGIVEHCAILIMKYNLHLHIEVERKGRLGDYHPHTGKGNHISINHNLNKYNFLITFLHELAHHTAYKKYGNRHQPHGNEWKEEFKKHMRGPVMAGIFPPDINGPLIKHMKAPSYTHTGDVALMKALAKYDKRKQLTLDDIEDGALFKISKGSRSIMRKISKRRTNVLCLEIETDKMYLVRCITPVIRV
jgi:hypothetical protein